ncbi:MAG: hypothetical protein HRT45_10650 [Bdellovibrionales bacterium]|nr:hypothetical protein [Bdellovibrionales bacterium]
MLRLWPFAILVCLVFAYSTGARASAPTIGEFFDLVRSASLQPTKLQLGNRKTQTQPQNELEADSLPYSYNQQAFKPDTSNLVFVRAKLAEDKFTFEVLDQNTGDAFTILVGPKIRFEAAAYALSAKVGLPSLPAKGVHGVQIRFQDDALHRLQTLWAKSPIKLNWNEFWSGFEANNEKLTLKTGVIVPSEVLQHHRIAWKAVPSKLKAQLSLFAIWLQCGDMVSQRNLIAYNQAVLFGFDNCFGFGLQSATPNMFAPNMFNRRQNRSKREKIYEFNLVSRDPEFQNTMAQIGRNDIFRFLEETEALTQYELSSSLSSAGLPNIVAQLIAAKLTSRRNDLIATVNDVLKDQPPYSQQPLSPDIEQIDDGEHIVKGVIVKNLPTLRLDHSSSHFEFLLENVAKPVLQGLEHQAKEMLAHFPYTGVELINFGQSFIGAGVLFRIKRSIQRNPDSIGTGDRYIVQDTVKLGLTGNIGRNFKAASRINLWLSAGAGYGANYSFKKMVGSIEEASAQHWLIPFKLIFQTDFNTLKPGETYAVQRGPIGIAGGGGNYRFLRKLRPAGYLLLGLNFFNGFQVTRTRSDDLYIIQGEDDNWTFATKLYIRAFNRYFRIPFAGYTYRSGSGYNKVFRLPQSRYESLAGKELLDFQSLLKATLDDWDVQQLSEVVGHTRVDFDYKMSSNFLSLFGKEFISAKSRGTFELNYSEEDKAEHELDDSQYFVVKNRANNSLGSSADSNSHGCNSGAVLQYSSNDLNPFEDGYLTFTCHILLKVNSADQVKSLQEFMTTQLALDSQPAIKFLEDLKHQGFELMLTYSGEVYWPSLQNLITTDKNQNSLFVDEMIQRATYQLEGRRSKSLTAMAKQQWGQFLNIRTEERRITQLIDFSFDEFEGSRSSSMGSQFQPHLLRSFKDRNIQLKLIANLNNSTDQSTLELSEGSKQDSPAKRYYQWRESTGVKGIIDEK